MLFKAVFFKAELRGGYKEIGVLSVCGSYRRTRAAAGRWGALAAWAQARPRTSGSRLALYRRTRKYRRAARLGCNGAQW
jgi:hypothetical protein